jgi:hypothetical protein
MLEIAEDPIRAAFEAFICGPPFELDVRRFPDDDTSAWPGSYKKSYVELAWQAFQAGADFGLE